MDLKSSWSSSFEFEDIEIIAHKKEDEEKSEKWYCDQCSLFFLEKGKLDEHKKKHSVQEIVNCKYCNKTLSSSEVNSDCYINRKCETCEYKCSKCPQRFLRHSSLMNHEKKHSSPKKKRGVSNNKKINGICPENVASSKGVKRRRIDTDDSEEQPKRLKTRNVEKIQKKKINPQVKTKVLDGNNSSIKTPKRSLLKARKSAEETNNCENVPVKVAERLSLKTTNLPEGKVGNKHKHNTTTINSLTSPTPNMSSNENVVNYKPFSCHVCGDTFASDSALLGHIRTHGENAVKSFKCKYCGDEFDDVYKMQYHLAICPLAEDELETSLKQAIPVKLPIKYGGETCSPRKRGRPKKKVEMTSDQESYENKLSPSSCNKVNVKKRKSEVLENNGTVPKQSKKSQSIEPLTDPNEPLPCDVAEITKEKEVDDDKKKLHHCPFPRCDFKFTREKALLCHMRNHSDDFDDSLKCHKCDIPFDDIQTLRLHINECKGIKEEKDDDFNQPYRADCYDTSPSRTIQRSRKDFVCNGCGRSYQSQEKLDSHNCQGTASNPLSVTFPCRLCGEPLRNQSMLKEHFQDNHSNHLQFQCPTCNEEFDELDDINGHMMEHLKNLYDCSICLKRLKTKSELNKHYTETHPKSDRSVCLVCNKKFSDASGLAKHRHVHTGERPYFCPFCFKTFNLKSSHVNHVRRHINFRPYKCNVCPNSYFNSGDLRKHTRIHTGEKPYRCDICNARFRLKDVLNAHMKVHGNIRPYKCNQCTKAFKTRALLRYHLPIHTGIRTFLCPVCPVKYYAMTSLRGHIRRCHITEDLKCQICRAVQEHRFDLIDHLVSHRKIVMPTVKNVSLNVPEMSLNIHAFNLRNKRGRFKKNSSKSLPPGGRLVQNTPCNVPKKRARKSIKNSKKKKVTNCADNRKGHKRNLRNCPDDQTNEGIDGSTNGVEPSENYDIIEVVEEIKEEVLCTNEDDDVQVIKTETSVIEQCLMCSKIFDSHDDLMDHIYILI